MTPRPALSLVRSCPDCERWQRAHDAMHAKMMAAFREKKKKATRVQELEIERTQALNDLASARAQIEVYRDIIGGRP